MNASVPSAYEVVPPRLNEKGPLAVENLLQALALDPAQPFSLEIAGEPGRVRFLVRSAGAEMQEHLTSQLRLAYPQAELREVHDDDDPVRADDGLVMVASELRLRTGNHLPLKDWRGDREWREGADPILALLAALGEPGGQVVQGRALCQLVLAPAPADWSRGLERLALDNPVVREERLAYERRSAQAHAGLGYGPGVGAMTTLLALLAGGLQARAWWTEGQYLPLVLGGSSAVLAAPLGLWLFAQLTRPGPVHDPKLVAEKIGRVGYHVQLRLVARATTQAAAVAWLFRVQAAYAQYNLAAGNGFLPAPWKGDPAVLAFGRRLPWRPRPILNAREAATVWHLPQGQDEVPDLDRTSARRLLPTPAGLLAGRDGCPIGVVRDLGAVQQVGLAPQALRGNMLLVAKTGKGKSTLLERLAVWQATRGEAAVVVFDPHGDLAFGTLGALVAAGVEDPVYVDFADTERPVGLNLLDAHAGRSRDKVVANVIDIFSRVWERFWGARMEDCLRFCLLALYQVNTRLRRTGSTGFCTSSGCSWTSRSDGRCSRSWRTTRPASGGTGTSRPCRRASPRRS